jgi:hypothetical protein
MEILFLSLIPHEVNDKATGSTARDFLLRCVWDALGSLGL